MGAFLILSGLMVGVFSPPRRLLFYVFFEATLIPMYIIIGIWGGPAASTPPSSSSCTRWPARC
jgi:NADH-quinone oxidoreductase subunit M